MAKRAQAFTERKKDKFLEELAECGNVTMAAAACGITRQAAYVWRREDPDCAIRWNDALEMAADKLEHAAWKRAVVGWDEEVYTQKGFAGYVHKFDSQLLALLLKGAKPERYRERYQVDTSIEARNLVPTGAMFELGQALDAELGDNAEAREIIANAFLRLAGDAAIPPLPPNVVLDDDEGEHEASRSPAALRFLRSQNQKQSSSSSSWDPADDYSDS